MKRLILLAVCLLLCGFTLWGQVAIGPASLPNGILGEAYSQTLTATSQYGSAAVYTFSVASGTPPSGLTLAAGGTLSGTLTAVGTFTFTVQCTATELGFPPLTGTLAYTVVIYPVLAITTASASPGTVGAGYSQTFTATGGAGAATYTWSLLTSQPPPGLSLSAAGVLSGLPTTVGTYVFDVQVSSQIPAFGTAVAVQSFTVMIAAAPPVTITGSLSGGVLGVPYSSTLGASGGYGAGVYTFSPTTIGTPPPGLTLSSGGTLSGTPTALGTFTFTEQVTSAIVGSQLPPLTGTQSFTVVIYPAVAITPQSAGSGTVGVNYSRAYTATGGAGTSSYTWSVIGGTPPPGLTLSAAGVLSGIPTTAGTFTFSVQVSSQISALLAVTASQGFSVVIAAPPPLTITGSLSVGIAGVPYSSTLGAAGGYGTGAYTFSPASGTPPAGLTLSAGGTLSGTPTAAGTVTFTVQVTSTFPGPSAQFPPLTATQSFTVLVYPSLAITLQTANPGTVGVPYSQAFMATGGAGPSTYTWSLQGGTPPPGLTLSAAGVLSGTPATAGTFPVYVQVSSQIPTLGAQVASQWFTVTIAATASLTVTGSLGGGTVGVPYSATIGAAGGYGAGAYAFSLASGTLPSGLVLSAGGTLSGTPTAAGTSTFTVQVTNTYPSPSAQFPPLTGTQSFTVVVYPVLAITLATASSGTVGAAYSQAITATGGAGPSTYAWSLAGGTLPPGLTFSAAGVLSGIPTTAGSFTFSVQVSSQIPTIRAVTASQGFYVAIVAAPSLSVAGILSGGALGVAYSATLTGFGGYGTGAYAFSLASGTPPPGTTLSAGGTLSGTPTAAGTSTFTVQVTSTAANLPPLTATKAFTIVITSALTLVAAPLPGGVVGTPYSQQLSATGGSPPYRWTVASGALPAGITLDGTSGILSGTPTAPGSFGVTIAVSDTQQTVTEPLTITVGIQPAPSITISGLPATAAPATQPVLGLTLGSTYPLAIQGTITLTFAADSGPDDPSVQFTSGGRAATFQIPAGSTQVQFPTGAPGVQTGTVAGTITLTVKLTAAGNDITPAPAPTQVVLVAKSAPVITSATVTPTAGGFTLVVVGYSTPRDMISATVVFTPAPGVSLAGTTATVPLSQFFTTWYQDPTSAQFGSLFSLQIPFAIQNGTNPLTSVSVALTNSQGSSVAITAAY
jgi:large repetitive protein